MYTMCVHTQYQPPVLSVMLQRTRSICVHTLYQPPMLSVVLECTHTACKCYTWSCSGQVNIPADMVQSTPSEHTTTSE